MEFIVLFLSTVTHEVRTYLSIYILRPTLRPFSFFLPPMWRPHELQIWSSCVSPSAEFIKSGVFICLPVIYLIELCINIFICFHLFRGLPKLFFPFILQWYRCYDLPSDLSRLMRVMTLERMYILKSKQKIPLKSNLVPSCNLVYTQLVSVVNFYQFDVIQDLFLYMRILKMPA